METELDDNTTWFAIYDWANNELTDHGTFASFDIAWDYIYQNFEEDDFQELEVREQK